MKELHPSLRITTLSGEEYGQYRRKRVTIRGTTNPGFTEPALVGQAVEVMFDELCSSQSSLHPIERAAWLHCTFVQVHPFRDGNGRVGRLLLNAGLLQRGYPLACIQPGIRERSGMAALIHGLLR